MGGLKRALWVVYFVFLGVASVWAAERALRPFDYLYPVAHRLLGIQATIYFYGPKNVHRHGFEITSFEEQRRLFGAMVDAVHHEGRGLAELRYHDPAGNELDRFLTPAEIQHLEDVARFLEPWRYFGLAWVFVVALAWAFRRTGSPPPRPRRLTQGALGLVAIAVSAVLLIGPTEVFYWAHRQVFPPGHAWFFYYEESLMTMLMQAPNLFGFIVGLLALGAGAVFALAAWTTYRFQAGRLTSG